ncbi:MAG: hypothetical protein GY861_02280 [bacterium]|nr:hypothetical protein [bacterium]
MIWPLYATPYSAYLVELFETFLSYAPDCAPEDPYVPDDRLFEAWEDSRSLLQDYMLTHFECRPASIDETVLIDHCITLIERVSKDMKKDHDMSIMRRMLNIKSGSLKRTHKLLNEESARLHQEDLEAEARLREETPKERADRETLERTGEMVQS